MEDTLVNDKIEERIRFWNNRVETLEGADLYFYNQPVEALNGGSRKGENERVQALIDRHGYGAFGGSDAHLVSLIGICATEFEDDVRTTDDLVAALQRRRYRAVDFREQVRAARGGA